MRQNIWASAILLFLWVSMGKVAMGQEVLLHDFDGLAIPRTVPAERPSGLTRTAAPLSLPFFDDFSRDSLRPTVDNWRVFSIDPKVPGVSNARGTSAPSKGVCTFDGASFGGRKYSSDLETGINDSLTSMDIDLSGRTVADSVYLSFFLQRGGGGESPEVTDSFVVYFDTSGQFEYVPVLTINGLNGGENAFIYYQILLDSAIYFHPEFRFKFVSFGSLNGEYDQFHLDYVYLDAGRSRMNGDIFNDVSAVEVLASPFAPFTALPLEQYQTGAYNTPARILASNVGNPSALPTASMFISDPTGNNALGGTTTSNPPAPILPPAAKDTVVSTLFSDQSANFITYGAIRLNTFLASGSDPVLSNDTLVADFRVDTLLGYDDGAADFGYGTTSVKSICQQYTVQRADTLTALWINFTPSLHYNPTNNQSTCLDGKSFKIAVWDTLVPDSFLTLATHTVSYDSFLNDFVRYPFIRPLRVSGTFWVGIQQSDGMPIGVGWDSDGPSGLTFFEDVSGDFLPSSPGGCMMIRPEFGVNSDFVASRAASTVPTSHQVRLSPQPWHAGPLQVQITGSEPLRTVRTTLISLTGQEIATWERAGGSGILNLDLPDGLAAGMYLLRFTGTTRSGKLVATRKRLLIQPRP
ncbi:MAG: hypothetical protein AAGN35_22165 [Bacteroidota bacterium]